MGVEYNLASPDRNSTLQTMSPLSGVYAIVSPNFIAYRKTRINFIMKIIFCDARK